MTILKSTNDILISTDYQIVHKQALSPQAIIELKNEYKRYQHYKHLQGTFLPRIFGITTNKLTMEYCPGTHTANIQDIIQTRTHLRTNTSTSTIDRDKRQRLVEPNLVQKALENVGDGQQSKIIKQLVKEIINILHTKPLMPTSYCHGDLQSKNLIQSNDRIIMIDPKPVWMHYTYDIIYYAIIEHIDSIFIIPYCHDHRDWALMMLHCIVLRKIHVYTHAGEYHKIGQLLDRYTHMQKALNM